MKKLLLLPLLLLSVVTLAQNTEAQIKTFIDAVRTGPISQVEVANALDQLNYNKKGIKEAFTATGTNAYSVTVGAGVTSLSAGVELTITFTNANSSTTVTLNPNSIGATAVKDNEGNDPAVGDIKAGSTLILKHNGTHFRIVGAASGGSGGATAAGATGNVQFKSNGGGLQAEANFSYDSAANTLNLGQTGFRTPGTNNMFWGETPNTSITSGTNNVGVGEISFGNLTSGDANTGIGEGAGRFTTTGSNNTAVGSNALHDQTTSGQNVAVGSNAMVSTTTNSSTAVGYNSLRVATGNRNTAFGHSSLLVNTAGIQNTAVGAFALSSLVGAFNDNNVAVGDAAAQNQTAGEYTVVIGSQSGSSLTTGNQNTLIGGGISGPSTGSKNIVIGYLGDVPTKTASGQLNLQNALYGTGNTTTGTTLGAGNLGAYVQAPTARFHIVGGSATAGTAPLKIGSGTVLATTEAGAIENDGTHLYYTASNGGTRFQLDQQSGSGGTVTSASFTGGLISVGTPTTTPAFTVAGTSGGIPYFSSGSTWASSGALTSGNFVVGGGAGSSPTTVAAATAAEAITGTDNTKPLTALALEGKRSVKLVSFTNNATGSSTIDCGSKQELTVYYNTTVTGNITIALSNDSNLEVLDVIIPITGSNITITMPSTTRMNRFFEVSSGDGWYQSTKILQVSSQGTADLHELSFKRATTAPVFLLRYDGPSRN